MSLFLGHLQQPCSSSQIGHYSINPITMTTSLTNNNQRFTSENSFFDSSPSPTVILATEKSPSLDDNSKRDKISDHYDLFLLQREMAHMQLECEGILGADRFGAKQRRPLSCSLPAKQNQTSVHVQFPSCSTSSIPSSFDNDSLDEEGGRLGGHLSQSDSQVFRGGVGGQLKSKTESYAKSLQGSGIL